MSDISVPVVPAVPQGPSLTQVQRVIYTFTAPSKTFNDIKRNTSGISQQMLTRTLRGLERDGMLTRTIHPTSPPQVEYQLTEMGLSLSVPASAFGQWVKEHLVEISEIVMSATMIARLQQSNEFAFRGQQFRAIDREQRFAFFDALAGRDHIQLLHIAFDPRDETPLP